MTRSLPRNANQVRPRIPHFEKWLTERGASVESPTSEWELVRFRHGTKTAIVYTSAKGFVTYTGGAGDAFLAFLYQDSWRAMEVKRGKPSSGVYARLRQRDGDACFYCGNFVSQEDESVEHLLSVTHGGPSHLANYALAHKKCNAEAGHLSLQQKIAAHKLNSDVLSAAVNRISRRFQSGNNIPVEKATVPLSEWTSLVLLLNLCPTGRARRSYETSCHAESEEL